MLFSDEFIVGTPASARDGSLILPRTNRGEVILVGSLNKRKAAICLGEDYRFQIQTEYLDRYCGLVISEIRIEVDETSAFDPGRHDVKPGNLLKRSGGLGIYGIQGHGWSELKLVCISSQMDESGDEAAFRGWQIVIGRGSEKRIIFTSSSEKN